MTIAVVGAVAAAGAATWAVGRRRANAEPTSTAPLPPAAPPAPPVTPQASGPPGPAAPAPTPRRRFLLAAAGVITAVIGVGVLATSVGRATSAGPDTPVAVVTSPSPVLAPPAWLVELTPPATPTQTTPPAPVPVGGVLPPNGSVIMRGDSGEEMTLTVARVVNPAPALDPNNPGGPELTPRLGYRLVSVIVRVENTGGVPFIDDVEQHTWLVDENGRTHPHNTAMTDARQLHPPARLDPRWLNAREIIFEVPGDVELTRFRLSRHPGVAKQTQDWRLA